MNKVIRNVNDGIVQITTIDERWYVKQDKAKQLVDFVPSVTWIVGFYPKGTAFYKWLANHGWDESQTIKNEAADKGSKVHYAINDLIKGKEVKMNDKYFNESTGQEEELTVEEYDCLISFAKWYRDTNPKVIKTEVTGFKDNHFAGTVDLICEIENKKGEKELWIVDFKTGQNVWPSYELQLSAYKNLPIKGLDLSKAKLAVLQVGYRRNKNGYKFTEMQDKYELFKAAYQIWQNETSGQQPLQKDYPESLKL